MHRGKDFARQLLLTYDNVLYAIWRIFQINTTSPKKLEYEPVISIVMPTYNSDLVFLRKTIDSVRNQLYKKWELIVIDDASPDERVRKIIKDYAKMDSHIVYNFLDHNHHIAEATNVGIKMAKGDFIALLDHDDLIYPQTLFEVVKKINLLPKAEFIYSDEDKIIGTTRTQPSFKPDWNLDLLHCVNYITHFAVIKKSLLDQVGYENGRYNGAQDWELFLRIGRNISKEQIAHIPKVLYSWRVHESSTANSLDAKPYVYEAQKKAVEADMQARGMQKSFHRNQRYPGQFIVDDSRQYGLITQDIIKMLGWRRTIYIILSSRMAFSRHIYRTASYDKIVTE